jgi:sulfate adenylyltransferase subunit 2
MTTHQLTHLRQLEAESIHIIREVAAEFERPVMLYSIGKDSAVMLSLALRAFYPGRLPFPLLHVDTTWKFREMIEFRDNLARKHGFDLIVHINEEGVKAGVNPFSYGSAKHTDIMKTQALKQALNKYQFDAAFGGARRDLNNIEIPSLYFAKERPVIDYEGVTIMLNDERVPPEFRKNLRNQMVRFRTLGCYPLTGAIESQATTLPEIIQEMLLATTSERQGRLIDSDQAGSMEQKKREGYF